MSKIGVRKCVQQLRESRPLVVVVVFIALMLDVMMMTSVDPILPAILRKMSEDGDKNHNHNHHHHHHNNTLPSVFNTSIGDGDLDLLCTCSPTPTTTNLSDATTMRCHCSCLNYSFRASCAGNFTSGCLGSSHCKIGVPVPRENITGMDWGSCSESEAESCGSDLGDTVCQTLGNSSSLTGFRLLGTGVVDGEDEEEDDEDEGNPHMDQSMAVGVMVAAKPATELVSNILVGYLVDRVGHRYPMIIGCLFNFVSTVGFAYAGNFWLLMLTRIAQAIGSSLSVVAGLVFLASVYTDDAERAKANSRAFGGISMGVILGYPYGSTVYQFLGKEAPFLILAGATLLDGALRMMLVSPNNTDKKEDEENQGCLRTCNLLSDVYILLGLGSVFLVHFGLGVFLGTGPAWMLDELGAEQWSIGVVLAVAVIFHISAQIVTGILAIKVGRWLFCFIGTLVFAAGIATYPLCTSIWMVLGPEIAVRIGHGTVLCVISPLLGHIVDLRHKSHYGTVYGLYTASYNLGISLGSISGGIAVKQLSFRWVYWTTAAIIFTYSFTSFAFKNPRPKRSLVSLDGVDAYGATSTSSTDVAYQRLSD